MVKKVRLPRKLKKALGGLKVRYIPNDDAWWHNDGKSPLLCNLLFDVNGKVTKWHWRMFYAYARMLRKSFDYVYTHTCYMDEVSELEKSRFNIINVK